MTESEGEEILCRFERRRAEGHGLKAGGVLVRMVFVGPLFFFLVLMQIKSYSILK